MISFLLLFLPELVLSDLCSTFDGVDLCSDDAILPIELLRRWSAQLCHVVLCLHSRGVVIQVFFAFQVNILDTAVVHMSLTHEAMGSNPAGR